MVAKDWCFDFLSGYKTLNIYSGSEEVKYFFLLSKLFFIVICHQEGKNPAFLNSIHAQEVTVKVTLGVLILNFLNFVGLNHNFNVPLMQGIFLHWTVLCLLFCTNGHCVDFYEYQGELNILVKLFIVYVLFFLILLFEFD